MKHEQRLAANEATRKQEALAFYGCVVGFGRFASATEICSELGWKRPRLERVKRYYREHLALSHQRVLVVYPAIGPRARYGVFGSIDDAEHYLGKNIDRAEILISRTQQYVAPVYRAQYGETAQIQRLDRVAEAIGVKVFADKDQTIDREEVA